MLQAICERIQMDVGRRGLASDPVRNLLTETAGDFAAVCGELATASPVRLLIVTGFLIPQAQPPAAETDGPLGAVFLARALVPLGIHVSIAAEEFCLSAIRAGLRAVQLDTVVPLIVLPLDVTDPSAYRQRIVGQAPGFTHLLALERVGPNHTATSIPAGDAAQFAAEVPVAHHDRCYTMRGLDITPSMSPAHWLFDDGNRPYRTIGIGDGGNEIGMGKVAWTVVRRNIIRGGLVACRVPTDQLIVAGISNWGAYGLAAGVYQQRGMKPALDLFDTERERTILEILVREGPLVDGVTGQPTATVDGLPFAQYASVLTDLAHLVPRCDAGGLP